MLGNPAETLMVGVANEKADAVLAYAAAELRRRGGRAWVVHVVPAPQIDGLAAPMVVEGDTLRLAGAKVLDDAALAGDAGAARLDELRGDLGRELAPTLDRYPDVRSELVVERARPADLLVEESNAAGLVVVGRHPAARPWGPHLGSTVRGVLRESTGPVLVVDPAGPRDEADVREPVRT